MFNLTILRCSLERAVVEYDPDISYRDGIALIDEEMFNHTEIERAMIASVPMKHFSDGYEVTYDGSEFTYKTRNIQVIP